MRSRTGVGVAVTVLTLATLIGFADDDTPSTDVARPNPAQPVARVQPIRQGDTCEGFGSTAVNEKGEAFDCEPGRDGVERWIYP